MSFIDRLDSLMAERSMNKNQLAAHTGIPVSTIYGWYKKGYDNMTLPTLKKLSEYFGVSMEFLVSGRDGTTNETSPEAMVVAAKFDALDSHGKRLIKMVLDFEYQRCAEALDDLNARQKETVAHMRADETTSANEA